VSKNFKLLRQVRNVAMRINQTSDNPEHRALLTAADYALNELMLLDSPEFYLDHIREGRIIHADGVSLAATVGVNVMSLGAFRHDAHTGSLTAIQDEIEATQLGLLHVVEVLDEGRSSQEKDFLVRLSEWESGLYNHSLDQAAGSAAPEDVSITRDSLFSYLEKKFPEWTNLELTEFRPLQGGFSKKTILFETVDSLNGAQSLVIRAEQPVRLLQYEGADVSQEFYMILLMRKAGLPIAEPLWLELDANALGVRFIVSRKAEGKTYGGNFGSTEHLASETVDSMIAALIQLHNVAVNPSDSLAQKSHLREWFPCKTVMETSRYYVAEYLPRLVRLSGISMTPLLLRALKWLEANIPVSDEHPAIIHIDFALNNLIIDGNKVTAILDWESSRLGDPAEDIVCTQANIAAYISMPEFLKKYESGTGRNISQYRLAYGRVAKCALSTITCLNAMQSLVQHDRTPISTSIIAYKYMAVFGSNFNKLIADAERFR
jgi:aminoglycoside phosphotransferase (APT) family kinase protein